MEVTSGWLLELENARMFKKVVRESFAIPPSKVNVIALRIPNYVCSGPVGVEISYKVQGLFKLVAGCHM
jgi:hypothetical protein